MNRQLLKLYNITKEEYLDWCKVNNKPYYSNQVKKEFFCKLQNGLIVKNKDGKLVNKEN